MVERNYASELAAVQSASPPTNPDDYAARLARTADVGPAQFIQNIQDRGITLWDPQGPVEMLIGGIGTGIANLALQANEAMPWGGGNPQAIGIDPQTGSIDPNVMVPWATEMAGMAEAGGFAIPKQANTLGTFGGRLSRTADQAALGRAEEMAAQGVPRETIWQETGWFQGADGKWRYEIPDEASRTLQNSMGEINMPATRPSTLGGALEHPELYAAYPEMERMRFGVFDDAYEKPTSKVPGGLTNLPLRKGGQYTQSIGADLKLQPSIMIGDMNYVSKGSQTPRSVLLHEGQHAVQDVEGFAAGGTPLMGHSKAETLAAAEKAYNDTGKNRNSIDKLYSDLTGEPLVSRSGKRKAWSELTEREKLGWLEAGREYIYRRLAGEVEARNVQTRMTMTQEQRRAKPPWETQDIPDEQQIIRK